MSNLLQKTSDLVLDIDSFDKLVNGGTAEDVTTRAGKTYPTLAKATETVTAFAGAEIFSNEQELNSYTGTKRFALVTQPDNTVSKYIKDAQGNWDVFEDYLAAKNQSLLETLFTVNELYKGVRQNITNATNQIANSRPLPFVGWGERYTKPSSPFNAVFIKTLLAATPCVCTIILKTAATDSHLASSTIAYSSKVVKDTSELTDMEFVLHDPITKAIKTVNPSDLSDEYFVGIYTKSNGSFSACGEPRGTITTSKNASYYTTDAQIWRPYTNNQRLAFDLVYINDITKEEVVKATESFNQLVNKTDSFLVPPVIYASEGLEANVYLNSLTVSQSTNNNISCAGTGQQRNERWLINNDAAGEIDGSIGLYSDSTGLLIEEKPVKIKTAPANAGSGQTKRLLVIGDSLIQSGHITQHIHNLQDSDSLTIEMLGTRGTGVNKHEGRGGWRADDYSGSGRTYYKFDVTGITDLPAINSATYSNGSSTFKVQEVSIQSGAGFITCSLIGGSSPTSTSGTLTKQNSSTGDVTISYTNVSNVSGNPFYVNNTLDFSAYLTTNSIASPDFVCIALGTNDIFGAKTDVEAKNKASSFLQHISTITNNISQGAPQSKICVALPAMGCSQDAFGINYGTSQTAWRFKRNIFILNNEIINQLKETNIDIVPCGLAVDSKRSYPYSNTSAHARTLQTEYTQTNAVHPSIEGYQQMADVIFAYIKNSL